jgi:transposase
MPVNVGTGSSEVFNALRWIVWSGASWRVTPKDLPPWEAVCQRGRQWMAAGPFEALVHDLRAPIRLAEGCEVAPTAAVFDARTLQSTVESGSRASHDGHERREDSKAHIAVDMLGHMLALMVTASDEQERGQVTASARTVQEATGETVEPTYVDRGTRARSRRGPRGRAGSGWRSSS